MKKQLIYIAIAALLLPFVVRGLWFYRGLSFRPEITTPDYASFTAPVPPLNTNANTGDVNELGGSVIIDTMHGNQFSMTEIDSLTSALKARGAKIEMTDSFSFENQLKYANAFISLSPSLTFSNSEVIALTNFAERGGKILVFTDATRNSISVDFVSGNPIAISDAIAANSLLSNFDISINNDYLYNISRSEGNFRNVFFDQFGKSEITFGLKEIALYGTHSVETTSGTILLSGAETNLSSINDAHDYAQGGAVLSTDGNVLAFGDITFLASPYSTYNDNAMLISNLADFALTEKQNLTLENFPYVFNSKTVNVFIAPDLEKNTDLITALSGLQSSLRLMNIEVEFVDSISNNGDTIIISTFVMDDKTQAIANKNNVIFDFTISTLEFGDVSSSGTGLLLLDSTTKGNNLVLLAGSSEDIIALIGLVSVGDISSCLTSESLAVCSVGFGGDFGNEFFEEIPTEEVPLEVIPTPGG